MSYELIENFNRGMDRRRLRETSPVGTLWDAKNVFVNSGGEVERRMKFVEAYTLPSGTVGMGVLPGQPDRVYVWGNAASASVPPGVTYQRLVSPTLGSIPLWSILDVKFFDAKPYVIAKFLDGSTHHFYDGVYVSSWAAIAQGTLSLTAVAAQLAAAINQSAHVWAAAQGTQITVTGRETGEAFSVETTDHQGITVSASTTQSASGGTDGAAGVRAVGSITFTGVQGYNRVVRQIYVGSEPLFGGDGIAKDTPEGMASGVNAYLQGLYQPDGLPFNPNFEPIYTWPETTLQIRSKYKSAAYNGRAITLDADSQISYTTTAMAGGVTAVPGTNASAQVTVITLSGSVSAGAQPSVTITPAGGSAETYQAGAGAAAGEIGTFALTFRNKLYVTAGPLLMFSEVNDPTVFTLASDNLNGAGFISMANEYGGAEDMIGLAVYQGQLAIFADGSIRTYQVSANDDNNQFTGLIEGTGALAPQSIRKYGNDDVFYLSARGVRSLRVRDITGVAYADEVGTPVDELVRAEMQAIGGTRSSLATSVLTPWDNQFWVVLGAKVFVYAVYPNAGVQAWTYFDLTDDVGGAPDYTGAGRDLIYTRRGDTIYVYGGFGRNVYPDDDEVVADIMLPYMAQQDPASRKRVHGIDAALTNDWKFQLFPLPYRDSTPLDLPVLNRTTYGEPRIWVQHPVAMAALRATCTHAGPAILSQVALHFTNIHERG